MHTFSRLIIRLVWPIIPLLICQLSRNIMSMLYFASCLNSRLFIFLTLKSKILEMPKDIDIILSLSF